MVEFKFLGCQQYEDIFIEMKNFTHSRSTETIDEIWLLEHFPVFTQGLAGKSEHILRNLNIPIVQSDRGGQVTYHGPGQLVVYFLLNLKNFHLNVRSLVTLIENVVITLLKNYGIQGHTMSGAPGVYVSNRKICSLGLKIRKGCSYHGLALNVDMDLQPFSAINPCGYAGLQITQLKDLNVYKTIDCVSKDIQILLATKLEHLCKK